MYLYKRYLALLNECQKRGFNVTDYGDAWSNLPDDLLDNIWKDYEPNDRDKKLVRQRIAERLASKL
jgi:hypothetical protein